MAESELSPTGIMGLDAILCGGLPAGNVVLVKGAPGTGKTLLGVEFVYRGVTLYDEPGIIVVFESSPVRVIRDARSFGWDLEALHKQERLKIVFTSPDVFAEELRSTDSLLLETAGKMGARRIFIDGISLLEHCHGDSAGLFSYRQLLYQLCESLRRESLIPWLSHEVSAPHATHASLEVAEYVADTILALTLCHHRRGMRRTIEILKNRGHDFSDGEHTLHFDSERGIHVSTRAQLRLKPSAIQPSSLVKRSALGVPALDDMLGGGLFAGSITMVSGVSGSGKSVLGMHFLVEGGRARGERGLLVTLDEHPAQVMRNASTINLGLQPLVESGLLHIFHEEPQELQLDRHLEQVFAIIDQAHIHRLVVDGLTTYQNAVGNDDTYREFISTLVSFVKQRLMTAVITYENPELFGVTHYMPFYGVTSLVDNVILLNLVELGDRLRYALTVAKSRGSPHAATTREYSIGEGGIHLLPNEIELKTPIPFERYRGLLSRAPTRVPTKGPDAPPGRRRRARHG